MKPDFAALWHISGMAYLRSTLCCIIAVVYELLLHLNLGKLVTLSGAAHHMTSRQWHSGLGVEVVLLLLVLLGTSALLFHYVEVLGRSPSPSPK